MFFNHVCLQVQQVQDELRALAAARAAAEEEASLAQGAAAEALAFAQERFGIVQVSCQVMSSRNFRTSCGDVHVATVDCS
jgi:hypothetical protein